MWWIIAFVFVLFIIIKKFVLNKLTISGLNNKHVFVTGCDTGFGHLLALKLVDNGIPTFAGCLTEKGKSELELKARTSPGQLWTLLLDVTKDDSMLKAAEFVKSQLDGQSRFLTFVYELKSCRKNICLRFMGTRVQCWNSKH